MLFCYHFTTTCSSYHLYTMQMTWWCANVQILCLQRDMASDHSLVDPTRCKADLQRAFKDARLRARATEHKRKGVFGVTRDHSMFFKRIAKWNAIETGVCNAAMHTALGTVAHSEMHESVLGPSSVAPARAHMASFEPLSSEESKQIVSGANRDKASYLNKWVAPSRWRDGIPAYNVDFLFLAGPALEEASGARLYMTPGALCLLPSNTLVGADILGFARTWDECDSLEGIVMQVTRQKAGFTKKLGKAERAKANHMMAVARMTTCYVVEIHVSDRAQESLRLADTKGQDIDMKKHTSCGAVEVKLTKLSFDAAQWQETEDMLKGFVANYIKQLTWGNPTTVATETLLGRIAPSDTGIETTVATDRLLGRITPSRSGIGNCHVHMAGGATGVGPGGTSTTVARASARDGGAPTMHGRAAQQGRNSLQKVVVASVRTKAGVVVTVEMVIETNVISWMQASRRMLVCGNGCPTTDQLQWERP